MKVTLDSIRNDLDAKYRPLEVDLGDGKPPVTLVQLLRLPRDARRALVAQQDARAKERGDGDGEYNEDETVDDLRTVIRTVASRPEDADRLLDAIGDDLALLGEIVTAWREGSQAGEAQSSAS